MRRDIASGYAASLARMGSWVVVSALVYRGLGAAEFAMLALVRGTIGLLNYTSLGLAPALIHRAAGEPTDEAGGRSFAQSDDAAVDGVLPYAVPPRASPIPRLYANAMAVASLMAAAGFVLTFAYALSFERLYRIPPRLLQGEMVPVVLLIGAGTILRLVSDVSGAVLQVRARIAYDNAWVAAGDLCWAAFTAISVMLNAEEGLTAVAFWYGATGLLVHLGRRAGARRAIGGGQSMGLQLDRDIALGLLKYGLLVTAAQLASYLYAPTDYILIDRLLSPYDLANYAPAVQIDAGLLLLVTGLSSVLLPKAALAHAGGSPATVRRYYVRGTLASLGLLAPAAAIVWIASPWLFRLWFGNSMPMTRAVLPLVLIHTVIGGSSAVGRSILLATGRVRPFAGAVLMAGLTNVACSYAFVRYFHWGLRGIVLGTIVAVVPRCALWMPWYVLRQLRTQHAGPGAAGAAWDG